MDFYLSALLQGLCFSGIALGCDRAGNCSEKENRGQARVGKRGFIRLGSSLSGTRSWGNVALAVGPPPSVLVQEEDPTSGHLNRRWMENLAFRLQC